MHEILCPHCRAKLIDDGSLSGQETQCPMCGGLFRMPRPTAKPAAGGRASFRGFVAGLLAGDPLMWALTFGVCIAAWIFLLLALLVLDLENPSPISIFHP